VVARATSMNSTDKIQLIDEYYSTASFECHPDLDEKLSSYFDYVYDTTFLHNITPRFSHQSGLKFTMRDYWWYIDKLYKSNPSSIVDLACGECEWKKFLPNIIGIDSHINPWSLCDIVRYIDDDFFKENQNRYDCGMNLHGTLDGVNDWNTRALHIHSVMSVVKHSALFALPVRSIKNIPTDISGDYELVIKALVNIIYNLGYEVLLLDVPSYRKQQPYPIGWNYSSTMLTGTDYAGSIRFILKHPDSDYRKQA
jgi:hypothetical protein